MRFLDNGNDETKKQSAIFKLLANVYERATK
jgi:hypothetical protein